MMNPLKRKIVLFTILAVIFLAPGLAAVWLYHHPHWLGKSTSNKGRFVKPPILIKPLKDQKKWGLVLWYPSACDVTCIEQLDKLRRIRLSMGRRYYDVNQWLLTHFAVKAGTNKNRLVEQSIRIVTIRSPLKESLSTLGNKPQVFLSNPDGYLILTYGLDTIPSDIYHDLSHLIRTTEH